MRILVEVLVIIVFCYACWKIFGKNLATYLANDTVNELKEIERNEKYVQPIPEKSLRQQELEDKIAILKEKAEDLKTSTDELKVTKMLEEIEKQLKEKEDELKELDNKIWLNK